MAETGVSQRSTSSQMKRLLIPVLAAILIGVLTSGGDEQESGSADSGVSDAATDSNTVEPETPPGTTTSKRRRLRPWPAISLKATLQHDPFRFPSYLVSTPANSNTQAESQADTEASESALAAERVRRVQQLVARLQTKRVSVFLQTEKGTAAVIDSQIYHEGDLFEEGVRIREIGPDGVTFDLEDDEGE